MPEQEPHHLTHAGAGAASSYSCRSRSRISLLMPEQEPHHLTHAGAGAASSCWSRNRCRKANYFLFILEIFEVRKRRIHIIFPSSEINIRE
jgi:hypothetical protein